MDHDALNTAPALTSDPAPVSAHQERGRDDFDFELPPECIPNIDELVIEDGKPVESIFAEKQYRLLTEPLYHSWPGPGEGRSFLALANVGLFYQEKQPPLVPDVMLSLDVPRARDLSVKENRSYFTWIIGKAPNVVIEVVSDRQGSETSYKLSEYARVAVPYYVVFDPRNRLGGGILQAFVLHGGNYQPLDPSWLPNVGLGLMLWQGEYEGQPATWLRWCDRQGTVIPTGGERIEQERQRAEQERQRAERLAQRLRELGVDLEG